MTCQLPNLRKVRGELILLRDLNVIVVKISVYEIRHEKNLS